MNFKITDIIAVDRDLNSPNLSKTKYTMLRELTVEQIRTSQGIAFQVLPYRTTYHWNMKNSNS